MGLPSLQLPDFVGNGIKLAAVDCIGAGGGNATGGNIGNRAFQAAVADADGGIGSSAGKAVVSDAADGGAGGGNGGIGCRSPAQRNCTILTGLGIVT